MNKVWIYQADRILSDEECEQLSRNLIEFTATWTAHGSALVGKAYIKYNLFLILAVDESQASVTGCSIDKSVHFIKSLAQEFNVNFFDRMKVSFRDATNTIQLVERKAFENLLQSGLVNADTIVFNNMLTDAALLASQWEVPFKESWHSKVF